MYKCTLWLIGFLIEHEGLLKNIAVSGLSRNEHKIRMTGKPKRGQTRSQSLTLSGSNVLNNQVKHRPDLTRFPILNLHQIYNVNGTKRMVSAPQPIFESFLTLCFVFVLFIREKAWFDSVSRSQDFISSSVFSIFDLFSFWAFKSLLHRECFI